MARVSLQGVLDDDPPTETTDPVTAETPRAGRHRQRPRITESPRPRRERPAFSSSPGGRAFRLVLCLASLAGLVYATTMVLGVRVGGDQDALGLPSRQSGQGGRVETIGPIDVRAEDEPLRSAGSATTPPSPSTTTGATATPPAAAAPPGDAGTSPSDSDADADDEAVPPAAAPPAEASDPTPSSSPDAEDETDDRGKLIDVNLLGIHIAI